MAEAELNPAVFHRRLARLVNDWKATGAGEGSAYGGADALAVAVGKSNDDIPYSKSVAIHNWLFEGLEMPDTLLVITRTEAIFMASPKKAALLATLQTGAANAVPLRIVERQKTDSFDTKFDEVLTIVKGSGSVSRIGVFKKDIQTEDPFHVAWNAATQRHGLTQVDMAPGVALVLAVKDEDELRDVAKSAEATSLLLKNYIVDRLETVIDQGDQVTHVQLAEDIDRVIGDEKAMRKKVKLPDNIALDSVDTCYLPIIQSGGVYDLKPSAVANEDTLHFGTIVVATGLRYKGFCTNIARTFLIDATPEHDENYKFLLELQKHVLSLLRPGTKFSDVYAGALAYVEAHKPALKDNFLKTKNIGFSTGLEFRESALVINEKTTHELQSGMVLNLLIGLQDIPNPSAKSPRESPYSLLLGDTVQVTNGAPVILTNYRSALDDVSYKLQDDDGAAAPAKLTVDALAAGPGSKVVRSRTRGEERDESAESARQQHQKELWEERQRQNLRRFQTGASATAEDPAEAVRRVEAYKNSSYFPRELAPNKIFVDTKRDAILVPIYGVPVPFHIATVKSVALTKGEDGGEWSRLRINFNLPGQGQGARIDVGREDDQKPTYIRELTFRSLEATNFNLVSNQIKDLIKKFKTSEAERRDKESLVAQEELVLSKGRVEALQDVMVRPNPDAKRVLGTVEIHENGIRYRSAKGSRIDVPFSNIRHLIFQPCKTKEVITILHLHLKNPIMVGNKKTKDVQFFREVVDDTADETAGRRRGDMFDQDEIEAEERERRQRKAHDKEFKAFGLRIAEKSDGKVDLDTTDRELGFDGVPSKSMVFIQPTAHALVHLTELPFMVVTFDDVEFVSLERVQHGNRNFDIVFVYKDFKRPPTTITTVDMKQLPNVQELFDSMDLPFAESRMNMKWPQILKTVTEDAHGFFEDGGWKNVLEIGSDDEQAEDEEDEDEDEESDEYQESESEEESSDEYTEDEEFDEDEDEDYEDEESEDEGKDWDELEREAKEEDLKKRGRYEEDDRPAKKRR